MGVSATGERGLRARTVPILLLTGTLVLTVLYYLWGPSWTPGVRNAAEQKCNELNGANYRSFRLDWVVPQPPNWDQPHWICKDARNLEKPGVNFGWWVNPF